MNFHPSLCRSEVKSRIPASRNSGVGGRCSLQNDYAVRKGRRSSSLDSRARPSVSTVKPRASSEERKSLLFPGQRAPRKSSINLDGGKPFKELRPLNDRDYLLKKTNELKEFLTETSQQPLDSLKLMQPSKKDFERIFQHLVQLLDPSFEVRKLEEDVPRVLKMLQYPFIPSKSAFTYVARNNWPSLLGVLLFLMDIAKFSINLDTQTLFNNSEVIRPEEHKLLAEYFYTSYFDTDSSNSEEKEKAMFVKIIRARNPYDIEELQTIKQTVMQELEALQREIESHEALMAKSKEHDNQIQSFNAYFARMGLHKKAKEENCQKLEIEKAELESTLASLKVDLSLKQSLYEAQGFDGQKELLYIEGQMEELAGKIRARKAQLKELQDANGEAEIQLRLGLDKDAAIHEAFNSLYSTSAETAQNIISTLKSLKDPQVDAVCDRVPLHFPECRLASGLVSQQGACRAVLEELKRNIDAAELIFKELGIKQSQKMHELLMKKSELTIKLKLLSSEESQKEKDLASKERQALESTKLKEMEVNELIQKLDTMQAEQVKLEEELAESQEEFRKAEEIQKERKQGLEKYLADQRRVFAEWENTMEEVKQTAEKSGERILKTVEEAVKRNRSM